jgi:hypothetical protein
MEVIAYQSGAEGEGSPQRTHQEKFTRNGLLSPGDEFLLFAIVQSLKILVLPHRWARH